MIYKYYAYNIVNSDGEKIGSRVVKVNRLRSPLYVMSGIVDRMEFGYAPSDLKRIH